MRRLFSALCATLLMLGGGAASAQSAAPHPLEAHMAHHLTGSARWRSPNPAFRPGDERRPQEFGVSWRWGANRQHLIGEVTGHYADGRTAQYHTIYVFYDPVSKQVLTQQIGWDGSYLSGSSQLRAQTLAPGQTETIDMTVRPMQGDPSENRHEVTPLDAESLLTRVYVRSPGEEWRLESTSTWRLRQAD